ncbi:MAG TPA: OmpA family protein [Micropepsaceae bacterium]|nr:OmpA family protein [Micropepsaceae bacterium]
MTRPLGSCYESLRLVRPENRLRHIGLREFRDNKGVSMKLKGLLLSSAFVLALPGVAAAEAPHGWYVDGGVGAVFVQDNDDLTGVFGVDIPAEYDTGIAILGSVGYKWMGGFRLEGELGYRASDLTENTMFFGDSNGDVTAFSGMLNLLYDWQLNDNWQLSLGGGIGYANVDHEYKINAAGTVIDDDTSGMAWQGIAELHYQWTSMTDVYLGYNYFTVEDDNFTNVFIFPNPIENLEYDAHAVMLGVRMFFGAAPAAVVIDDTPPPPPDAPIVENYIVFFDFNKSNLSAEAQAVVAEAAATYQAQGYVSIDVVGHTDTVGSASYNQGLSERRAAAVASELVSLGVPADKIMTSGRGFSDPLVPTGPGVREPQNRRAVINLAK